MRIVNYEAMLRTIKIVERQKQHRKIEWSPYLETLDAFISVLYKDIGCKINLIICGQLFGANLTKK